MCAGGKPIKYLILLVKLLGLVSIRYVFLCSQTNTLYPAYQNIRIETPWFNSPLSTKRCETNTTIS